MQLPQLEPLQVQVAGLQVRVTFGAVRLSLHQYTQRYSAVLPRSERQSAISLVVVGAHWIKISKNIPSVLVRSAASLSIEFSLIMMSDTDLIDSRCARCERRGERACRREWQRRVEAARVLPRRRR